MANNVKQLSKVQRTKLQLREEMWPSVDESLWLYKDTGGWLNIPRSFPLVCIIMDLCSKGKPISAVYTDLWCRTYNDSFVTVNKRREMALCSGFSGERAERTWLGRVEILQKLGFIDCKPGSSGPLHYILIYNPFQVIKKLHGNKKVSDLHLNLLKEQMVDYSSDDLKYLESDKSCS